MANPKTDHASTADKTKGVPAGAPSSSGGASASDDKFGGSGLGAQSAANQEATADAINAATANDDPTSKTSKSCSAKEPAEDAVVIEDIDVDELEDAVLEAEAAAIVDDAMDEVRAEADAAAAQKEVAEWKDKYVRLHAEWDTYRRRTKEQAEQQKALAAEKLVTNLIPIIDDLERTIDYAEKNGEGGLLDGVKAVTTKFIDTLVKDGVVVIDPQGEAYDALEAQAVGTVDDDSVPNETVSDVYQKGYKIGSKVLRPAMVTVTTGGPQREQETE